jgi:hypothetical protein
MAQTTLSTSARNARVAIGTDGSTWTDISGSAQQCSPGDGKRLMGSAWTFDGDGAIIVAGKLDVQESKVKVIYTESALEGYAIAWAAFTAANSTLYARVDPLGSTTGNYRFTSNRGVITAMPAFGDMDASSGDVQTIEFSFSHGGWTKALVP